MTISHSDVSAPDGTRPRRRGVRKGQPTAHSSAYLSRRVADACLNCPYNRCIGGANDEGCQRYRDALRAELQDRRARRRRG